MTSLLLAIALLQANPDELRTLIEKDIREYINEDTAEADRPAILERLAGLGPAAICHIQKWVEPRWGTRLEKPLRLLSHKVKILMLEKAEDFRGADTLRNILAVPIKFEKENLSPEQFLDEIRVQVQACLVIDPTEQESIAKLRVTQKSLNEPVPAALDRVLAPLGLDFFVHGAIVVIARRDKLWPEDGGLRIRELKGDDLLAAEGAVARLDTDQIEEASRAEQKLVQIGPSAIPLVQKALKNAGVDYRARCLSVISAIRSAAMQTPLHVRSFARTQKLADEDADFIKLDESAPVTASFNHETISEILKGLNQVTSSKSTLDPKLVETLGSKRLTIAVTKTSVLDLLEVIFLPMGSDVKVEKGRYVIVPKP